MLKQPVGDVPAMALPKFCGGTFFNKVKGHQLY